MVVENVGNRLTKLVTQFAPPRVPRLRTAIFLHGGPVSMTPRAWSTRPGNLMVARNLHSLSRISEFRFEGLPKTCCQRLWPGPGRDAAAQRMEGFPKEARHDDFTTTGPWSFSPQGGLKPAPPLAPRHLGGLQPAKWGVILARSLRAIYGVCVNLNAEGPRWRPDR